MFIIFFQGTFLNFSLKPFSCREFAGFKNVCTFIRKKLFKKNSLSLHKKKNSTQILQNFDSTMLKNPPISCNKSATILRVCRCLLHGTSINEFSFSPCGEFIATVSQVRFTVGLTLFSDRLDKI